MSITDRTARDLSIDCDGWAPFAYFAAMFKIKAYALLIALLTFVGYFGVYGFYTTLADSIGEVWAFVGAAVVAVGVLIIAAVGITMIKSRPPEMGKVPEE